METPDSDDPKRPRSDQAPGEEAVQVNDWHRTGGPPPDAEPFRDNDQHRTGG